MRYGGGIAHADPASSEARDAARQMLKVLLTAHYELTEVAAEQAQLLRSLLLGGNNGDHALSRGGLSLTVLTALANRKPPHAATDQQMRRHKEIQRLAQVVLAYRDELSINRQQMATIVNELAPGITNRPGTGPFKAAKAILDSAQAPLPAIQTL
jgi:hypothetical protein